MVMQVNPDIFWLANNQSDAYQAGSTALIRPLADTYTIRWLKRGNTWSGMTNSDLYTVWFQGFIRVSELQAADCNGVESSFLAHIHHFNGTSVRWPQCTLALFLNRCIPSSTLYPHECVMSESTRQFQEHDGERSLLSHDLHTGQSQPNISGCSDGWFTLY